MTRSLDSFRPADSGVAVQPDPTVEEAAPTKHVGKLLALDPSLASTGWVLFINGEVDTTGVTTTASFSDNKTLDRMERAAALWMQLYGIVRHQLHPDVIVFEAPEMAGAMKFWDPSPLIASTVVSVLCKQLNIQREMIRSANVKEHIVGKKGAKKAEVAAAMRARYGEKLKVQKIARLNEHVYDAMALGVTYIEKLA